MNVWGDRRAGAWLAAGLAGAATALCLLRSAGAQTPTGPSSLPLCPSAFSLVDFPLDSTLAPSLETAWVADERVIRLSWDTGSGATCAFFQVQDYAGGYSGSGTIAGADFITGAGQGARLRSPGSSGK